MSMYIDKLDYLKNNNTSIWSGRIISQLRYAIKLSRVNDGRFDRLINDTIIFLDEKYEEEGTLTNVAAQQAEERLLELSSAAKSFKVVCAAHAHIDMNWMWGYAETAAIVLETFRTMLNLMNEYPDYKFSQSQASVYRIVEEFDPDMLEEIKARVKEGRWEVTASTWVETDKNMPNGESFARHILYTKKYLSKLLDIDPESLQLDFEPDTFGHSQNIPEILTKGGVKYYYHCRGDEGHNIYRWIAPSGSSLISYREPLGYNSSIDSDLALMVPEFCRKYGISTMLKVYGVGDHGGGPTRRDLEKIIEMNSWPIFPTITFGTFAEFFNKLDAIAHNLPVIDREMNFMFTGCYTTHTRIKLSNRISEARLHDAEAYSTISSIFAEGRYPGNVYKEAWKKVLFNHFHDILPGSGVMETKEYALGQFQQVMAATNTGTNLALRNIASKIDTSILYEGEEDIKDTQSEGAGVGFGISDFGIPQTERGRGKKRILHFFNATAYERQEPVEITVWDWPYDKQRIEFSDMSGKAVKHQILEGKAQQLHPGGAFWGHEYMKLLVDVKVPAYGYSTYLLKELSLEDFNTEIPIFPRVELADEYILENDFVKVVMDTQNASFLSMIDKKSGKELIDSKRPAGIFRLIEEDDSKGMTAWFIGRYMNIYDLNHDVKIKESTVGADKLRQWVSYRIMFRKSRLDVMVSLDCNSSRLNFDVDCDWQEVAKIGQFIPQLNFHMPLAYKCKAYKYDIPFGIIVRNAMDMDVPGNSWALGLPEQEEDPAIMVVTNTKYGFRGFKDSVSVALIRSSYNPDPYPDNGIHLFKFAVELVESADNTTLIRKAFEYNHSVNFLSNLKHIGTLRTVDSFLSLESGNVAVSAIKMPEDGNGKKLILRVYETQGAGTQAVFKFKADILKAWYVDVNENRLDAAGIEIKDNKVSFKVDAGSVASIYVEF